MPPPQVSGSPRISSIGASTCASCSRRRPEEQTIRSPRRNRSTQPKCYAHTLSLVTVASFTRDSVSIQLTEVMWCKR